LYKFERSGSCGAKEYVETRTDCQDGIVMEVKKPWVFDHKVVLEIPMQLESVFVSVFLDGYQNQEI
jgi:hypothetical protein